MYWSETKFQTQILPCLSPVLDLVALTFMSQAPFEVIYMYYMIT